MNFPFPALATRHGTISNFCSISISIFSGILFSKSISISKFFKQFLQYQNQYQYQNFPTLNIKINIKIFQNPESISKSISISSKYWYWYWKSKFFGTKSLLFNLLWILCHLGHHLVIHIEPKTWILGLKATGTRTDNSCHPTYWAMGPNLEPIVSHLWTNSK